MVFKIYKELSHADRSCNFQSNVLRWQREKFYLQSTHAYDDNGNRYSDFTCEEKTFKIMTFFSISEYISQYYPVSVLLSYLVCLTISYTVLLHIFQLLSLLFDQKSTAGATWNIKLSFISLKYTSIFKMYIKIISIVCIIFVFFPFSCYQLFIKQQVFGERKMAPQRCPHPNPWNL